MSSGRLARHGRSESRPRCRCRSLLPADDGDRPVRPSDEGGCWLIGWGSRSDPLDAAADGAGPSARIATVACAIRSQVANQNVSAINPLHVTTKADSAGTPHASAILRDRPSTTRVTVATSAHADVTDAAASIA